jgi:hypothetical protein
LYSCVFGLDAGIFLFSDLHKSDHTGCRHHSFFCTFLLGSLSERVTPKLDSSIEDEPCSRTACFLVVLATGGYFGGSIFLLLHSFISCICFKICRPRQSAVSFSESHRRLSNTINYKLRHEIPVPVDI